MNKAARTKRYFGTDGIRGRVGASAIEPQFILKLGWAVGRVLGRAAGRQGPGEVLIGKDTRVSGYMLESALESGLAAAGMNVGLLGPMPTPAVAYLTRALHARAGIVISASHNPFHDNGVKLFSAHGGKLPDAVEREIEEMMERPMEVVDAAALGKARRINDAAGRYIEFCKNTVGRDIDLNGLRLAVDCAHGAAYATAPAVFRELGAEVIVIGVEPDGFNINADCGSTHLQRLAQTVREGQADLGIALDGDGDRCLMVDARGEAVDGDELLYLIVRARHAAGELRGPVVGTAMSNLGLEKALRRAAIPFLRAAVGDRHVLALLREQGGMIGGEQSGHLICLDRTTTGDGIVSALQVVEHLVHSGEPLHALKRGMQKYPQTLINVATPAAQGAQPRLSAALEAAAMEAERALEGRGRVLLRPSGTEPTVRVMVESQQADEAQRIAEALAARVEREFAAPQEAQKGQTPSL